MRITFGRDLGIWNNRRRFHLYSMLHSKNILVISCLFVIITITVMVRNASATWSKSEIEILIDELLLTARKVFKAK